MPNTFDTDFARNIYKARYQHPNDGGWAGTATRVTQHVMAGLHDAPRGHRVLGRENSVDRIHGLIERRAFMPGGRYLYAAGRPLHQVQNCLLLKAEDTREGWAELQYKATMALMTGAGIGVWYGDVREANAPIQKTGGVASGPIPLMQMVNETGRNVMQGGARRSAIWAGLPWWHPDVDAFIRAKDWPAWLREAKGRDWNTAAPLDMTNISVCLDDEFFRAFDSPTHPQHDVARSVYFKVVDKMVTTGEPGFSVDTGDHSDEVLRNACTEITSADDSDVCNLGSLVLPRFESPSEFGAAVRDATLFLTAGTLYSHLPYDKVHEIREKNRRLGLGLIGVHEFLLKRGVGYGTAEAFEVLDPYMVEYEKALGYAVDWQDALGISRSVAATAVAPNGTIGIVAESTPSGDPLFSAARKRVVKNAGPSGDSYETHVIVDPVAARLVKEGVDPDLIEDAYSLAYRPERRMDMQVYLQRYTDHAISSTLNLPYPITDGQEQLDFAATLYERLPYMRGVTAYPDGARAGQPLTSVPLAWALENEGITLATDEETCVGGACGV